jgi:RNA 3'-terminal phosphate cyclase (ATP)
MMERVVDGSMGEGGGQVIRTALSLAALGGFPLCLENIRAGRSKPGLLRQHLTGLQALQRICGGEIEGGQLGSTSVRAHFGTPVGGEFDLQIGSAGSTTLVLQTIVWPLLFACGPSTVRIEGGTHNGGAPVVDFLTQSWLPLLRQMGARVNIRLEKYGFYPAGGGAIVVKVEPSELQPLSVLEAGPTLERRVLVVVSGNTSERHLDELRAALAAHPTWGQAALRVQNVSRPMGPGLAIVTTDECERVSRTLSELPERGARPAELLLKSLRVHDSLARREIPVCEHLADQLLLPMVLAGGGSFRTTALSLHSTTNAQLLEQLTGCRVTSWADGDAVRVEVTGVAAADVPWGVHA